MSDVFLAGGVRTPIGQFCGAFAEVPATVLGSTAAKAALSRSGAEPEQVDGVIFGNVLGAGLGQNVARQVAIGAGLSSAVCATTVDKVCGSSLKAVMFAAQAIRCGDASVVLAGGTENMSRAPYLLDKARGGYRMGDGSLVDSMIRDGLWDVYNDVHMGSCGDTCARKYDFSRADQDDYAVESYRRALDATASGAFKREIVPVESRSGRTTVTVSEDEEPKRFDEGKLRELRPAFAADGTVTAGNASSINDGAAAVVIMSQEVAAYHSVVPQARILGYAEVSREPEWFTLAPIGAISHLLDTLSFTVDDVGLFEINEAYSVVPMAAMRELGIPVEKVNVNGGAVALGHPIGASGARVLVTLLHAMEQRGVKTGVAALCIGGGEAVALAVERG